MVGDDGVLGDVGVVGDGVVGVVGDGVVGVVGVVGAVGDGVVGVVGVVGVTGVVVDEVSFAAFFALRAAFLSAFDESCCTEVITVFSTCTGFIAAAADPMINAAGMVINKLNFFMVFNF